MANATPGLVIAIQALGHFLGFNPHCHALASSCCFYTTESFKVVQTLDRKRLEKFFRHKVLNMLLAKEKLPRK
jgi:hypothetical protein